MLTEIILLLVFIRITFWILSSSRTPKTVKRLHPHGDRLLGRPGSTPCPMSNCPGVSCKLYLLNRYRTTCWIPIIPRGPSWLMVQCHTCNATIDFEEYKQWRDSRCGAAATLDVESLMAVLVFSGQMRPGQSLDDAANERVNEGNYDAAEAVARVGLNQNSHNINLMCMLDVALNGMGRAKESESLGSQIVYHWETHFRQAWIASGRREEQATFPRVFLKTSLPGYSVQGNQYYEPQRINFPGVVGGVVIYKILVNPTKEAEEEEREKKKKNDPVVGAAAQLASRRRVFRLIQTRSHGYVLKECTPMGDYDAIFYSEDEPQQPDIRKVTSDVVALLAPPRPSEQSHPSLPLVGVSGSREELIDEATQEFQINFDLAAYDPRTIPLQNSVQDSNWRAVRDFLATLLPEERSFWMGVVGKEIQKTWLKKTRGDADHGKMSPMLDSWKEAEPDNIDCRLLRLETYIVWAWNARTGQLAAAVSNDRMIKFHKRLMEAAQEFHQAKYLCAQEPMLYSCGMTIVRGLGEERVSHIVTMEQCCQGLKELSTDPLFYNAHFTALQYYCQKWGGSHQKMFDYARSITTQLPDGHPLWILIPQAHMERVLIQKVNGYWQREEVRREILDAYRHAFPPGVATVATHTTAPHRFSKEWACRNYFAYALVMTQQYEDAREQIRVIGKRPMEPCPWRGDYKYYTQLLGFDVETTTDPTSRNRNHNNDHRRTPLAQATAIAIPEIGSGSPSSNSIPVVGVEEMMPLVAEAEVLPEVV